jgi:ABC-type polysaccharide/polyol phosphate export permease
MPLSAGACTTRQVLILATSLSKLVEFLLRNLIVMFALVACSSSRCSVRLIFPVIVAIRLIMAIGLMFPLAVFRLYYDLQHALPIVIHVAFLHQPRVLSVAMIPEPQRTVYYLNPIVGVLELFHKVLYEGWPSPALLVSVSAVALVLCAAGHAVFRRYKEICVEIA